MKDGDIIEQGKHEELLEKNGFYAELYNSQFCFSNRIVFMSKKILSTVGNIIAVISVTIMIFLSLCTL